MEKKLQAEIIKFLQSKGAYVLKNDASYRAGVPDLAFWHPDLNGFIEVKAHENSPFRPLQERTIARLEAMGVFCRVVHAENWSETRANFDQLLEPSK
jgi:Holliday junction resolvase-like predicted endonuclease